MSPRNETATPNMYNNMTAGAKDSSKRAPAATATAPSAAAGSNKTNVEMQPEAYQRTLEYVQQCQSWSSSNVMSPDSSSVNGAKPKRSPPHPAGDGAAAAAAAMPPPMTNGGMTPAGASRPADNNTSNMIIGDMSSS